MYIQIRNPNSPQVKYTKNTDQNLLDFRAYVSKLKNSKITYKEFQEQVELLEITTGKYVRVEFPFFKNAGIINDYTYIDENLFTKLGEALCKSIENIRTLEHAPETLENKELLEKFKETKQYILRLTIQNMTAQKDCGYGQVFKQLLNYLSVYKSVDETEFALIIDQMKSKPKVPKEKTSETVERYREDAKTLTFKVESINKETKTVQLGNKTNCYSYYVGILEYAGYVYREEDRYYLNNNTLEQIQEVYGGKYE